MREKLVELDADNCELCSTLKTVVGSHAALQLSYDSLQSQLTQRDKQLTRVQRELTRLKAERDNASTVSSSTGCTL